ncbi:protein spaetzle isoform X2 [Procambarus clarkii]|uniref:protein spaetzle isoform X2 n=1 Tax=Procambarus clarkii TaxID=6728 RepID=UPI001E67104E|nr:protein spaetzle-like isoform X2 [Procambarus clarkii]
MTVSLVLVVATSSWVMSQRPNHPVFLPGTRSSTDSSITFLENPGNPVTSKLRTKEKPKCSLDTAPIDGEPCNEDPEYDNMVKQHVAFLLSRNERLRGLVNDPSLRNILRDVDINTTFVGTSSVNTRITPLEQESPVCSSAETLIFPKRGKTSKNDWVFVVNQDNVQQALRVEKCINEGESCNFGMPLQGNTIAVCRQKYVYRRMLTVGSNDIQPEEVLMPSCCVCYARKPGFDLSVRVGASQPTMTPTSGVPAPSGPPVANTRTMPWRFTRRLK